MKYVRRVLLGVFGLSFFMQPVAAAEKQVLVLGSGSKGGVYLPVGRAICKFANSMTGKSGVACKAKTSAGSVTNLRAMGVGKAQIAIAQSDVIYHSYTGTAEFKKAGPNKDIRSLFSLHSEPFTLVVQAKSGIRKVSDLLGKRVNIGTSGSGHRETIDTIMLAKGWKKKSFSEAVELAPAAGTNAFCNGQLDAMVLTVGHPSKLVKKMTNTCGGRLLDIVDSDIAQMVKKLPYYSKTNIPSGLYKDAMRNIRSFGSSATVISTAKVSKKAAYAVVKSVFDNFKKFKNSHQALKFLDKKEMVSKALSAPLHPGAIAYYKEAGLM